MKKRLLIISMHLSSGGMPQYLLKKIEELNDTYEIFVIEYSFYGSDFVVQRNKIIDIVGKNFYSLGNDKSWILSLIGKINPDIIYMGELPEMFMDIDIAKQIYNTERKYFIVATTHDSSWDIKNIKFLPDQFIFVSEYSKQQFAPLNIPSEVVLYPIEYKERPDRTQALLELGLDPNKKHVLNIGIFTRRKNQGELFEYARNLQNENIEFHFVGSLAGNFEEYWKPIIDNKPDNCRIWGERSDVDKFYSCMDLFVFTSCGSPGDMETNPLVIRESISWNIPLLMYNLDVYLNMYDKYDNIKYLNRENKDDNIDLILNELKISKNNYPLIYVYSHNYLVNNWKEILEDQLNKLVISELYSNANRITYGVYCNNEDDFFDFTSILMKYDELRKIRVVRFEENNNEFSTLNFLQQEVGYSNKNIHVLYYHLKGVTSKENHSDVIVSDEAVTSWRNVMEYFLIENWRDCIKLLEKHDTVGCFWNDENHYMYPNMYCGNFWWSKSSHIKELPKIDNLTEDRMNSEKWIGMKPLVWYNWFSPTENKGQLYEAIWKPEEYRKDIKENRLDKLLTRRRMFLDYLPEMIKNDPDSLSGVNEIIDKYLSKDSIVAEVGSYAGVSCELFAIKCNKVYAIDTWDFSTFKDINSDIAETEFDSMIKNYSNIVKIKKDSISASKEFEDNSLDCVYIDACHDYECVFEDIVAWLPKIKNNGIICGHDYNQSQVYQAVYDSLGNLNIETFDDSSWLVKLNYKDSIDSVCVITSHPNYKAIEDTTLKCLKSLQNTNRDVILATHCDISEELQEIANYWEYDKNNPMTNHNFYNKTWFNTGNEYVEINLSKYDNRINHAIACHNNIYNGVKCAEELGYKYAICSNFDIILDENDYYILDNKLQDIKDSNKKGFFMYQEYGDGPNLKTVFFIVDVNFYLENFKYLDNEIEYNNEISRIGAESNTLENYYYNVLKSKLSSIIIETTTEDKLLPNSFINVFSMCEYFTVLPIDVLPEYFCIWYSSNNKIDSRELHINVIKNGEKYYNDTLNITEDFKFNKRIHFKDGDNYKISIRIFNENGNIIKDKTIVIDDIEFKKLHENGIIKPNNRPKISVITRIKNMSNQIELLYISLMSQTFKDFEWIIFDNKSTDDIYVKVHEWKKRHKNIEYKYLPEFIDFWSSYTETNGKIIVVVDADDFLTIDALQHIFEVFDNNDIDLYVGKSRIFGSTNMKLLDSNMFDNTAFHPTSYTRCCIENTLEKYNIEYPLTDDHEIVNLMIANEQRYFISDEILYFYRKFNEQSITWNSTHLNDYQNYPDWQESSKLLDNKVYKLLPFNSKLLQASNVKIPIKPIDVEKDFELQNTTYDYILNSITFLTITDNLDNINGYIESGNKLNNGIIPLLVKEESLENNFRKIIKFIDKYCDDYDIILYCDKNSHLFSTEFEILTKFHIMEKQIVFAAEKNINPDSDLNAWFNEKSEHTNSPYKYLNPNFIGYASAIRKMLDKIIEFSYINKNDNIQHQFQLHALSDDLNNIGIDTECVIFLPLDLIDTYEYNMKYMHSRIYNNITKSYPSIVIGSDEGANMLNRIKENF